jgi:hypothetical protein
MRRSSGNVKILVFPATFPTRRREKVGKLVQENAAYASMVSAMDENVGRILQTLKETGWMRIPGLFLPVITVDFQHVMAKIHLHQIFAQGREGVAL